MDSNVIPEVFKIQIAHMLTSSEFLGHRCIIENWKPANDETLVSMQVATHKA